jgi:hypothetical protein
LYYRRDIRPRTLKMKLNQIKNWLDKQKEGICIGAIIAIAVYYFNWTIPFLQIQETGIKKLIILLAIFTIGGAIIDSVYKPNK